MSLESFKSFVHDKPSLLNYVESGSKTWQDFYNMYTLYGENSSVWDKYLKSSTGLMTGTVTLNDLFNMVKNIDVSSMRESITSLQKGINYINNIVKEKESNIPKRSSYEARPMYRYFDD